MNTSCGIRAQERLPHPKQGMRQKNGPGALAALGIPVVALVRATWQLFASPAIALPIALCAWALAGGGGGCSPVTNPPPPSALVFELVKDRLQSHLATLAVGADGNVYGSTSGRLTPLAPSVPDNDGTVFRIDGAGVLSTIHTFPFWVEGSPGALTLGSDGAMHAVTTLNVFFRVDQQADYTALLLSTPSQSTVFSKLVLGSDGALYGALSPVHDGSEGGSYLFLGGVARITNPGTVTVLGGNLGLAPGIPFVVGSDGALYGSRDESTFGQPGAIVRWDSSGQAVTLHQYSQQEAGGAPPEGFALDGAGLFYAVTPYAGSDFGAVLRFDNAGAVTVLHEFDYADGAHPTVPLALGSDGAMYGVAPNGGSSGAGTVFRIDPSGAFSLLHSFNFTDGVAPDQTLFLAKDGSLYGVGQGSPGAAVFRVDPAGMFTSFPVIPYGLSPSSPLVQGTDCALYGVANTWDDTAGMWDTAIYRVFEPGHLCQRIQFDRLPDRFLGNPPFTVSATASSGLPVSIIGSGSCTVTGDQVTLAGAGLCTLTASQAGDAKYQPATEVSQTFRVLIASSWGCGIGPELALLVVPLWWRRRGRES